MKAKPSTKTTAKRTTSPRRAKQRAPTDDGRTAADVERDQRLRAELQEEAGRDPLDRHRERLTPVEDEEDGVAEDGDEEQGARAQREQTIREQDDDDVSLR